MEVVHLSPAQRTRAFSHEEARKREEADLRDRQDELDRERAAAQVAYVAARKAAKKRAIAARNAFRKAGGRS
jgi:hypothetical protein